jgi:hypothetical protein
MVSFAFEDAISFGQAVLEILRLSVNAGSFSQKGLSEWDVRQLHGLLVGGLTDAGEVAMERVTLFEQVRPGGPPLDELHLDLNPGQGKEILYLFR